jgi:NitT/TauT family transport system permease protein
MTGKRWKKWAPPVLLPIAVFVLLLLAWAWAIDWFQIEKYQLQGPRAVFEAAARKRAELVQATWLTARVAVAGYGLSLVVGVVVAVLFSQSRLARTSLFPYAIFLQTVPIVAIAPLMINFFGYGFQTVVLIAFIISLFPIITNGTTGLMQVDPQLVELFRMNRATWWQQLWKLRLPHATPYLLTGAKTSGGLAVIGTIVGELFAGYGTEQFGLAYLIIRANERLKTDELFAAVIASTLLGVAFFAAISLLERTIFRRWSGLTNEGGEKP